MPHPVSRPTAPDAEAVREALRRALASRAFRQSKRMTRFLSHVVELSLTESPLALKEISIGTEVFDRPATYDPKVDPVVRNEARRLRRKLEEYYTSEGSADPVRISIPRGGYVAKFEFLEEEALAPAAPQELPVQRPRRWFLWVNALVGVGILAVLAAVFWTRQAAPGSDGFTDARFSTLTALPTREVHPSVSPDGTQVLYSSDQNGNYDVYLTTLDGQASRLTSSAANEIRPVWSPDGHLFAFLRASSDGFDVVIKPVHGGPERVVGRITNLMYGQPTENVLMIQGSPGPAWSPGGGELAFTTGIEGTTARPIEVLTLNSGRIRVLTHPPSGSHDFYPAYSPDGRWLAFCRWHSNSTSSVYLVPAEGGEEKRLTFANEDIRGLAWMPDGKSFLISSNRAGPHRLWLLDRETGRSRPFQAVGDSAREPSVSRDGRVIVYGDYSLRSAIWSLNLKTGGESQLLPSTRVDHSARYSPDGKSVVFVSDRSGSWELWSVFADGSDLRQLTHMEGPLLGTPNWSPDGKYIAFDARPQEHSAIYVIPATGGMPRLVDANSYEDKMPSWSHDGRWIYFNSNRGGSQQLWRIPANGGTAQRVAEELAMDSAEAPSGEKEFFLSTKKGVWQVPPEGGQASPVPGLDGDSTRRHWAVTPQGIWFYRETAGRPGVWFYDFMTGQIRRQMDLPSEVLLDVPGFSVSPDGSQMLISRHLESQSDLILVRQEARR